MPLLGSENVQARNFTYTWFDGGRNVEISAEELPSEVADAVHELEDRFDPNSCACFGGLVILARTWDDRDVLLSVRIQELGRSGGWAFSEMLTCKAEGRTWRAGEPLEIQLMAPGYVTFSRKMVAHLNEIVIWSDVVLQRPTPATSGDLLVRVSLEGGTVAKEIPVFLGQAALGFTDDRGEFRLPLAPTGKHGVFVRLDGYVGSWADQTIEPGKQTVYEQKLFRTRSALVHWAYQPDGSRRFDGTVRTGWAILSNVAPAQGSLVGDFEPVPGKRDFDVLQVDDKLLLLQSDKGYRGRGSVLIADREFDAILEAPEAGYSMGARRMVPGLVLVFLSSEGKSYGKLEVVDIVDTPEALEELKAEFKVELTPQ